MDRLREVADVRPRKCVMQVEQANRAAGRKERVFLEELSWSQGAKAKRNRIADRQSHDQDAHDQTMRNDRWIAGKGNSPRATELED